ncbi:peptide methionine sulfoxide reductase [Lewinella sp. W8]|uniref:peptide methionine sulfoxide reductase n=1 Tax=Lewinella sp. W8 TaxID=2528208 RepID=UPI001067C03F|nr:peptide methionine sulfoxide reductase [Lewinella sp. W8]MTB50476.1 peptide methionine sulfoxide reductase [Lewinella sp. W8]
MTTSWWKKLRSLPEGYSTGRYRGNLYGLRYQVNLKGRVHKFYAEELGGNDFVSLNVYLTLHGPQLKPCEMPTEKVITFLESVHVVREDPPRKASREFIE